MMRRAKTTLSGMVSEGLLGPAILEHVLTLCFLVGCVHKGMRKYLGSQGRNGSLRLQVNGAPDPRGWGATS